MNYYNIAPNNDYPYYKNALKKIDYEYHEP